MKISELIEELEQVRIIFGDIAVCMAQKQNNKKLKVRLTATTEVYFQYGACYVTNMSPEELAGFEDVLGD